MTSAWSQLFASRKFWVGFLTVVSVVGAVVLRVTDKIPAEALVPTISSVTAVGLGIIGSIAWEDVAKSGASSKAEAAAAPVVSVDVPVTVDAKPADESKTG